MLGIGTGWYELEHRQFGFDYGTFTDRFDRLNEALQIVVPMIEGQRPTFSGRWYHAENAMAEPCFRGRIPLLIGGSGEKKTFPLAVRHFDHLNITAALNELADKVNVLRQQCEDAGRDPATLETSALIPVVVGDDLTVDDLPPAVRGHAVVGSAEAIADTVKSKVINNGVDGVILTTFGYSPGRIEALGDALKPFLKDQRVA